MIADCLLTIISIMISLSAIIYVFKHRENYGPQQNVILIILLYIFVGIFYFSFLSLATMVIFDKFIALDLWKASIIISLFALGLLSSVHSLIIGYKKIELLTAFIFSFLGGIIIYLVLFLKSFEVQRIDLNYYYIFQNFILFYFMLLLGSLLLVLMWSILLINYSKIRHKILARLLLINTLNFTIIIFTYGLFLLFSNLFLKYLHLVSYLITALIIFYEIIKKPDLFIELTNRIYDFIIFHKSGILLYSYNFETGKETEDSLLKGSILIGINHILANLTNQKDKLGIIKMENRDIVLEYDDKLGYAILLITNKKNHFIDKSIQRFMNKFVELNLKELSSLNGLIDTSHFKNAGELIHDYFRPYLKS
ncbi:MAG: hypothetical protein ACFFHV_04375 [Promethearchaeota archaeon]